MPTEVEEGPTRLSFTREEAWVVHVALLARVRTAVDAGEINESYPELDALLAVENGRERFADREVRLIRAALDDYLDRAPPRDLAPGRAALRRAGGEA